MNSFFYSNYNSFMNRSFFNLTFSMASLTAITIVSPMLAYLLLDPPKTFIHSILFAQCCLLLVVLFVLESLFYTLHNFEFFIFRIRSALNNRNFIAHFKFIIFIMGIIFFSYLNYFFNTG